MAPSARAARKWDRSVFGDRGNWWFSTDCQAYYNEAVCGRPYIGSSQGPRERLRAAIGDRSLARGVSIGAGSAAKELSLLQDGLVDHIDLWEISEKLIRDGEAAAGHLGLSERATYRRGDVFATSTKAAYDLVYWDHALHHMSDVGAALAWSKAALRPGGYLLINDYAGPNRLQWPRDEIDVANSVLSAHGMTDLTLSHKTMIDRLKQWRRDPSEAPQSERILPLIARELPGAETIQIGGVMLNILGPVLVPRAPDGSEAIRDMLTADADLRAAGHSHFFFTLWRKPV